MQNAKGDWGRVTGFRHCEFSVETESASSLISGEILMPDGRNISRSVTLVLQLPHC